MNTPSISIFQNGQLLHANRGMFKFDGFGVPTGTFGNTQCFDSVAIVDSCNRRRMIDGNSYGGGCTVCVRFNGNRHWYGIGSATQVASANLTRLAKS
ncbi:hypothetical protein K227x_27380 [Rubripirellula lacrimiformis]|uniref:Uncharacterized protein n=1 Tax=Rubripirellula lacrimiformis TaxID=1930273 RepID=A0A517NB40_9BACT|nr:hypothetical protein [Rubripirellula lacrimiformis]QDT04347.1 hypothetical protein K227x_27380 [Rubripirellula lacrimiformis]